MQSKPRLGYIILYVENVLKTVAFYQKAFAIELRFIHESNVYAEMETGNTTLAFADEKFIEQSHLFQKNRSAQMAPGAEIAFIVEEVGKAFELAVAAGAHDLIKPTKKPWGQTVSYVRDLNGFIVEICDAI